jgi:hypothetical protein
MKSKKLIGKKIPSKIEAVAKPSKVDHTLTKILDLILEENPSIIKAWKNNSGYLMIKLDDQKLMLYHRYVVEQVFQIKLGKGIVIHHIDGNPLNNNIENLLICTEQQHLSIHKLEAKKNGRNL